MGRGVKMSEIYLEMKNITKAFYGVKALDNVNFSVKKNEIHALVGENGAGKSTLMNILSGVYPYGTYSGDIILNGEKCMFQDIKDSERHGIAIIHQELALVPYLSIAENVFLGNEQASRGIIDWNETKLKTDEILRKVGLREDPDTPVIDISVGKQQLVEIAKALAKEAKLIIFDEPTAALNEEESSNLLNLLLALQESGVTSILISHKLNEVEKVADSITILRDGKTIETLEKDVDKITEDRIIKGMVGRDIVDRYPKRHIDIGDIVFEVKDWTVFHPLQDDRKVIKNVSFNLRRGEILGFAGLMGAGRTELAMSLFGESYGSNISGHIYKEGKEIHLNDTAEAIDNGIAYLTEDRRNYGLIFISDIKTNITLAKLDRVAANNIIDHNEESVVAEEYRQKMNIKSSSVNQGVASLSGGNQQKVVLSRWIFAEPDILILDEPTRGIDVGAKYEIYTIMNDLVSEGKSIILISSELPELLGMCDRIYVLNEGEIIEEVDGLQATQEYIMGCIMEHSKEEKR